MRIGRFLTITAMIAAIPFTGGASVGIPYELGYFAKRCKTCKKKLAPRRKKPQFCDYYCAVYYYQVYGELE